MSKRIGRTRQTGRRVRLATRGKLEQESEPALPPQSASLAHSAQYEIQIRGRLDARWSAWFESMKVTPVNGETIIVGTFDQSRLRGVLNRIWDLNLTLISVARTDPRES
jgi:hypothetical protein